MTRWRAFAIHMGISGLVGLMFFVLALGVWYPGPLFRVSGAGGLLRILVPVDLVLGPLLTLIVFRAGKTSLKFDLTVIALLQAAALIYGGSVMWQAKPVVVAFNRGTIEVIRAVDMDAGGDLPGRWLWPSQVYVQPPANENEKQQELAGMLAGRSERSENPDYYRPLVLHFDEVRRWGLPIRKIRDEHDRAHWQEVLGATDVEEGDVALYPLLARGVPYIALVDVRTMHLLEIHQGPIPASVVD